MHGINAGFFCTSSFFSSFIFAYKGDLLDILSKFSFNGPVGCAII